MDCKMTGFPVLHYLLLFAQTHVHGVGDAIQPSHPRSPPSPPALSLSQHQCLFQWVSSFHHAAKVLELQLHISPSNEYLGLISFRIDWFDLLAIQGTLKSLLQHHSSKASVLPCSAFFMVQIASFMVLMLSVQEEVSMWVHKIFLKICCEGLVLPVFPEHRVPHSCSPSCIPFRGR